METRTIKYYKTKKDINFNDGFELKEGTKIQFNFADGQIFNVQIQKGNEKRIFWIHSSEVELYKTIKEKWLKKDIEEHNVDLNDKWFEHEKKQQSKNGSGIEKSKNSINTRVKITKRESKPKQNIESKKSDIRTGNKTGVRKKKGENTNIKRGTTKNKKS